ncbi:MAG: hypothetical protein IKP95_01235 [Ruminococcus sp.]|nr:hypothetical protein [Ruminococcus sp.]
MQREKITSVNTERTMEIEETRIKSFDKCSRINHSFRVFDGEYAGVQFYQGIVSDEEGYRQAEQNLALKRPYKFSLETGSRCRDKTEREYTDREFMDTVREMLDYLSTHYPDFTFGGSVQTRKNTLSMQNSLGLDHSNTDCILEAGITYKHKDSKDLFDGWFDLGMRDYDMKKFKDMADNYLSCFNDLVELPEELIIQQQYYSLLDKFHDCLDAENLALGTSLLSGKLGEKVFADSFTLLHDVSDKETWFTPFFDAEGVVLPEDRFVYIENGVMLSGYADKYTADKYGVPHTGSAGLNMADIPYNGSVNLKIQRSEKTAKELLGGRLSVVPIRAHGGGYNDKGEYVTPVQHAMLCDGERFIGRLPEFAIKGSMFDIFGKDFIGVTSDDPIFNDKNILVKMSLSV